MKHSLNPQPRGAKNDGIFCEIVFVGVLVYGREQFRKKQGTVRLSRRKPHRLYSICFILLALDQVFRTLRMFHVKHPLLTILNFPCARPSFSRPDYFTSLIDKDIRFFCTSTSRTLTFTISPIETTSIGCLTYLSLSCEICTRPS